MRIFLLVSRLYVRRERISTVFLRSYILRKVINIRYCHDGEHVSVCGHLGKLKGSRLRDIFRLVLNGTYLCDSQSLPYLSKLLLAILEQEQLPRILLVSVVSNSPDTVAQGSRLKWCLNTQRQQSTQHWKYVGSGEEARFQLYRTRVSLWKVLPNLISLIEIFLNFKATLKLFMKLKISHKDKRKLSRLPLIKNNF